MEISVNMPQLRWTFCSYKNHKRFRKDEKEWTIVDNTHEHIISQELWDSEEQKKLETEIAELEGYFTGTANTIQSADEIIRSIKKYLDLRNYARNVQWID